MKGFKCFGLLLLLFIMVGLSLNVSSDVSAYKYVIDSLPIMGSTQRFEEIYDSDSDSTILGTWISNYNPYLEMPTSAVTDNIHYPFTYNLIGEYDSSTNTCSLYSYSSGSSSTDFSDGTTVFRYPAQRDSLSFNSLPTMYSNDAYILPSGSALNEPDSVCNIYGYNYASYGHDVSGTIEANMPKWHFSNLADDIPVDLLFKYQNSIPYFYNYNYMNINYAREDQGMHYISNGLKMSDIFNDKISSFNYLAFSFNLFNEGYNYMSNVSDDIFIENINNFDIIGSIKFDSDYTLGSNASIGLQTKNYMTTNSFSSSNNDNPYGQLNGIDVEGLSFKLLNGSCSFNDYHISSGDDDNRIDFNCSYPAILQSMNGLSSNIDFEFLDFLLVFSNASGDDLWSGSGDSSDLFLSTNGDYSFSDFYIVTNNNSTPYDMSASGWQTGGNTVIAPGGADDSSQPGSSEPNWFQSLINLFAFNFTNPFAPIFYMFTNQDQCASISTIGSMLHAEETQVCPWFNSQTRNVVTPVVSLVSAMLIFGFAVRWLGSSSGNMFEDQTSHKWNNTQFKQRGKH